MKHLTTSDSVKNNVRPISGHLDDSRIDIYIDEAEQLNIKPIIGDELFIDLLDWVEKQDDDLNFPKEYKTLMNGGNYQKNAEQKIFKGLIKTIEYYVYAKLVKNNDNNITRFGFVNKDDEYSSRPNLNMKLAAEKDALSVADRYMSDCIDYLNANSDNIPKFKKAGKQKNRLKISIIGN